MRLLLNLLLSLLLTAQPIQASISKVGLSPLATLATADFQTLIGDQGLKEGGFAHAGLHGLVGCIGAAATGADCAAGALGGVVQSIYAGTLEGSTLTEEQMLTNVNLIGALAGYFASGGKGENVSATASIAQSGLQNNYLSHREIVAAEDYRRRCLDEADQAACNALDAQLELDYARDDLLDACVGVYTDICQNARRELRLAAVDFFQKNADGEQTLSGTGLLYMNRTIQIVAKYFDPNDNGLAALSGPSNYGYATERENELARIAEAFRVGDAAGIHDGSMAGMSAALLVTGFLAAGGAASEVEAGVVAAARNAEFRVVIPPRPTLWTTWENYPKVTRMTPNGPQEFAIIGGRAYSEHAVARMQPSGQRYSSGPAGDLTHNPTSGPWASLEPGTLVWDGRSFVRGRSISPTYVEDIIRNTAPTQQGNKNWNYTSGNIQVILSPDKMRVISIIN